MAAIAGRVTDELAPIVSVRPLGGAEVDCMVDTGFTGWLVLPAKLVNELKLPIIADEFQLEMVGGEEAKAAIAFGEIEWLGEIRPVFVIVKDDYLLGSQLLEDTELVINYRRRTVSISN